MDPRNHTMYTKPPPEAREGVTSTALVPQLASGRNTEGADR